MVEHFSHWIIRKYCIINFVCRSKRFVYNMPCISMMLESSSEHHFFWPVLSLPKCSFRSFVKSKLINPEEKTQTLYTYIEPVIDQTVWQHHRGDSEMGNSTQETGNTWLRNGKTVSTKVSWFWFQIIQFAEEIHSA